jgi:hypothetical protein
MSLVVGAVIVYVAIGLLYSHFWSLADRAYPREYPMAHVGTPAQPPAPRLQVQPREELEQMRAQEDAILGSYGWVDANGGVVHIPIEQAMKLTLEQGLPARAATAGSAPAALPARSISGRTLARPER